MSSVGLLKSEFGPSGSAKSPVIAACAISQTVTTIKVTAIANSPSTNVPTNGRHHRCPAVRANR